MREKAGEREARNQVANVETGVVQNVKLRGLWKINSEIDAQMNDINKEKDNKMSVKTQIQFRKILLGAKHKKGFSDVI